MSNLDIHDADFLDEGGQTQDIAEPTNEPCTLPADMCLPSGMLAWGYFLKAYKTVIDRVDDDLRKAQSLSLTEFEILFYLQRAAGRIRFIDLARVTLLSQSRISRQIDALERKGLVVRESTEVDRRATYARVTSKGELAFNESLPHFSQAMESHFTHQIPPEMLPAFTDVLKLLMQKPAYAETLSTIMSPSRSDTVAPHPPDDASSADDGS